MDFASLYQRATGRSLRAQLAGVMQDSIARHEAEQANRDAAASTLPDNVIFIDGRTRTGRAS